eukprot:TRINITY_DN28792_c0_g1_i1.p1 TRINITY_DN28792_c0_g1~~TRINITY_DN28792_c0_g1_i1.p1  ORF type:complete len:555 (+),score=106.69 TRINITY_DN28792_c0_g1_i1:40-1665(+)
MVRVGRPLPVLTAVSCQWVVFALGQLSLSGGTFGRAPFLDMHLLVPSLVGVLSLPSGIRAIGSGEAVEGSEDVTDSTGDDTKAFTDRLNTNFKAVFEELNRLRAEQTEIRARLDACGCGGGGGAKSASAADVAKSGSATASEDDPDEGDGSRSPTRIGEDSSDHIVTVNVDNTAWLKEVLFGGKPWLIHCQDSQAKRLAPLPEVFEESSTQMKFMATFGIVDCWQRTESGKTLAHRFNFPKPPVTFAVANGDVPMIVDLAGVAKPWQLRRKVQSYLSASVQRIDGPDSFKTFCSSRRACMIVGFRDAPVLASTLALLNPLLDEHRGVRAVAVDTTVWKVKLEKELAASKPKKKEGQKEQASVLCFGRSGVGQAQARGGAFLRTPGGGNMTADVLSAFMERCAAGKNLVPIKEAPNITLHGPKLPKYTSPTEADKKQGSAGSPSASKSSSTKKKPTSGSPKKTKTKSMPSYSGARRAPSPGAFGSRSSRGSRGKKKQDHVGSRHHMETEEEPLFTAVEESEESDSDSAAEDGDDDNTESIEL